MIPRDRLAMPAATTAGNRGQRKGLPPLLWPFLSSALVVGAMLAIEAAVKYGVQATTARRPATGALGTTRSSDEPSALDHEKVHEPKRGRHAQAPWQIPWHGWRDILWRTYQQIGEDHLLAVAAECKNRSDTHGNSPYRVDCTTRTGRIVRVNRRNSGLVG